MSVPQLKQHLLTVLDNEIRSRRAIHDDSSLITHPEGITQTPWRRNHNVTDYFTFVAGREEGEVSWLMRANSQADISTISGKTIRFTPENLVKTRHELVAEAMTGCMHTDCSWSVMDSTIADRTTPDLIMELQSKTWVILEVGTTIGRTANAYRDKFMKYMITIARLQEMHPDWVIFFWIVIVNPHEVLSTFKLPGSMVNELILRFKIGVAMEEEMVRRGIRTGGDLELSPTERIVLGSISRLGTSVMKGHDQIVNEVSVARAVAFTQDNNYISQSVNHMFTEALSLSTTKSECMRRLAEAYSNIENEISRSGNSRTDLKSPVQVPLFLAQASLNEAVLTEYPLGACPNLPTHIDHLWRRAFESKLLLSEHFESLPLDEEIAMAMGPGLPEEGLTSRSTWHRVEINLETHAEQLSLDGLNGKAFKMTEFKEVRRTYQSRGFSLCSPTDDIARCVKIQPGPSVEGNKYMEMMSPLLEKANSLVGNTDFGLQQVSQLFNTDVVTALCQLSAVASELAVSLRQHVTPLGWIVKKILYYDIEILVRPTNSESHVFFLLRMRGTPIEQGAFRRLHHSNGWWYTDLLSINSSRLENLIRCPMIYVLTLLHFRINVDHVDMDDMVSTTGTGYSEEMAMLTLLIALEDKSNTEEMALNVRYLIMQFSKGVDPLSPPDPAPIIKKMPTIIRSRLAVYLYNQIKKYCFMQMANLPVKLPQNIADIDHSADTFDGLICPFTHSELRSLYDAVQCMYIAYAKNKDSTPEQNCDFAMIKKIAEYGFNTTPGQEAVYKGEQDPDPNEFPGPHEFSPSFLAEGCTLLRMRMRNDFGAGWSNILTQRILSELIKATHHEALATLKASADFSVADARIMSQLEEREQVNFKGLNSDQIILAQKLLEIYRRTDAASIPKEKWAELTNLIDMGKFKENSNMGRGRFKRVSKSCKCHEAVIKELKMDAETCPLLIGDYDSIFRSVMDSMGGVCCYLFKKNQHGGLREIYVLTFKSRLLQLLPEVAARVICGMCHEEVLTHPDKKTTGYEMHHSQVASAAGRGHSTDVLHRTSSEDKSKWSQGMNVSAFVFLFSRTVDPVLANAIARVMHAFRNKKVLLPEGVVHLLTNNVPLSDPTYEELRKIFWDPTNDSLFVNIRGNIFLKTPTGMWQGILHYCSSYLHVVQTLHYKNLCRLHFKMINRKRIESGKESLGVLVIDTVVSSDDSATYGSIILPQGYQKETLNCADEVLDFLLKLEVTHSRYFMMLESAKSCISSKTVGEFNSIFSCQKTYVSPAIKKVLAAATIPENEDIESRQIVLGNMYKDMLEEGCSHVQIHISELCNAFLHYSAFGLTTSRLFPHWAMLIENHPDPHLGFLLTDLQDCAGAFGYDFKKLLSLSQTAVPLMPTTPGVIQSGVEGQFCSGVVLTQGDRRRWLQLVKRVVTPGWESYLEENPHVLYLERGNTKEEITARLSAKACSKGVHDSLKEGNSITRLISSTVYLLTRNVVSVKTLDVVETGISKEIEIATEKKTLMSLTVAHSNQTNLMTHMDMTPDHKSLFYPNHLLHESVAQSLRATREFQLVQTVLYRKVRNRIEVRGSSSAFVIPLLALLRWKWFKSPTRYTHTMLEFSWNHYTTIFPWLSSTLNESLEKSPFSSHIRLFGFIQSVDKKGAKLNVLCKRLKSFNPFDQIIELAHHNQYPGLRRVTGSRDVTQYSGVDTVLPMVKVSIMASVAASVLYAPVQADVTDYLAALYAELELSDNDLNTLSKSRNHGRLAVLYSVIMGKSAPVISSCLLNCHRGVTKTYTEPQKWDEKKKKWLGRGRLLVSTGRVTVEALVFDSSIIAIIVKNVPALQLEYTIISDYLATDGFNWEPEHQLSHYQDDFPELNGVLTEWTCSDKGLFKVPAVVSHKLSKRGAVETMKSPADLLALQFPVIIQGSNLNQAGIQGEIVVTKQVEKSGASSLRVIAKDPRGGELTLMKYYGPKQPKLNEDCRDLFGEHLDNESLLLSWVSGTPISPAIGLALLRHAAGYEAEIDLSHTLTGVDGELLIPFITGSFKWRCISKSKIQLDTYRFIDDLETVEQESAQFTQGMQTRLNEAIQWFSDMVWGEGRLEPEPEANIVDVELEQHHSEEVDHQQDDTDLLQLADLEVEENSSSGRTTKVDCETSNFRSAPTMYMSHCFWDTLIDRLEAAKIWPSLREGVLLSGAIGEIQKLICTVLSIPLPDVPVLDLND